MATTERYSGAVEERLAGLANHHLLERLRQTFGEYSTAVGVRDPVNVVDIVVVGSFLKRSFRPGESDLDIMVVVDADNYDQHSDVLEDFWRYVNTSQHVQEACRPGVSVPVEKIDCCGVTADHRAQTDICDDRAYSLRGDERVNVEA